MSYFGRVPKEQWVMDIIRFNAVVGDDQVIHLPIGVSVPAGPCEVTVKTARPEQANKPSLSPGTWDWLLAHAAEAECNPPDLPSDLAENHDHYVHGKPRE